MKYLRDSWKGLLSIAVLFAVNATLWLTATPIIPQPLESTVAQIVGSSILLGFTLVFFLSTRNRLVTWLFNGLENVYSTHRWLAMLSLLTIFLHAQLSTRIIQYYRGGVPFEAADMGPVALYLFIGLTVLALLAKYMNYERWRMIHRLMVVPYLFAAYHAFFISAYALISFTPLGVWTMGMVLLGTGSSAYMVLLYRRTAFTWKGAIRNVEPAGEGVTEIEVALDGAYPFKTGQFAFIKIDKAPFNGVPHPFSISGATESSVFFTIKALGDFTQALEKSLEPGDPFRLSRPYGHMTFDDYDSPQVWIAGGIGITPFLSHLRSMRQPAQSITLYYSVRRKEEAVHLDYLRSLEKRWDHFTLHFTESDRDGFLSVEDIDLGANPSVFMCGPIPMARALKKGFKKTDEYRTLVYEAFSFTGTLAGDVEALLKRAIRRLRRPGKA